MLSISGASVAAMVVLLVVVVGSCVFLAPFVFLRILLYYYECDYQYYYDDYYVDVAVGILLIVFVASRRVRHHGRCR